MTYSITARSQLTYLAQPLFFISAIFILFFWAFGWSYVLDFILLLTFVIDSLPAAILHVQYLYKNFNSTLSIDRNTNKISYIQQNSIIEYDFTNIEQIIKVKNSASSYINARHPFTQYFYYKIIFNDEQELIVTCLLADDLEIIFCVICPEKISTRLKFYPLI